MDAGATGVTNRVDYQRMRPGESKRCLAIVASRVATQGRTGAKLAAKAAAAKAELKKTGG